MAKSAPGKDEEPKKKTVKDVNRGTQDEMEILALIVSENLQLRNSVMEKMKQLKTRQNKKSMGAAAETDPKSRK